VQSLGGQLQQAPTFRHLDSRTRAGLLRDLSTIDQALQPGELARPLDLFALRNAPLTCTGRPSLQVELPGGGRTQFWGCPTTT
jgi:hypothetical protein